MIGIISDIHGNYPALASVLEEIDKLGCETIICLGDICGYYCMVNECIEALQSNKIRCLKGNHDNYLLTHSCCESKTVRITIDYHNSIITNQGRKWLDKLPLCLDNELCSFRHAGWNDVLEERFDVFDFDSVQNMKQSFFFSGHSHVQLIDKRDDKIYCNPGAVGQPRDHDSRAAFSVFDEKNNRIEQMRVRYDIDRIADEMKRNKQGDWIWKVLYEGKRIGE